MAGIEILFSPKLLERDWVRDMSLESIQIKVPVSPVKLLKMIDLLLR